MPTRAGSMGAAATAASTPLGMARGGIDVGRRDEPSLDALAVALPVQALHLAPGRLHRGVEARDRAPAFDRARPHLRRFGERFADGRERAPVAGEAEIGEERG